MAISIFDLFKIGIGPSSSHTVGPMKAALKFSEALRADGLLPRLARVQVELFGSLGATGRGHGTPKAVMLGLEGEQPETVDIENIPARIAGIQEQKKLQLKGVGTESKIIAFDPAGDLLLHRRKSLPGHPNGMKFTALDNSGQKICEKIYYSVGGGFIVDASSSSGVTLVEDDTALRYDFSSADKLLSLCQDNRLSVSALMLENEKSWCDEAEIHSKLFNLWQVMQACIERGCHAEGELPGGLHVKRRAPQLYRQLTQSEQSGEKPQSDMFNAMDWVTLFALAVNEENAAGGRVVTAPTNGAAGIIPAVLSYFMKFHNGSEEDMRKFLLTAGAIGILYKKNASISGAEVGCQGEVGAACSMAAGALTELLGGTPEQVENAAEIAMEHNLGLTCDPIGGLVQVPCIERNAMASVTAINAARMAMRGDGQHLVSLDKVIKTMRQTGADMRDKYKETSRGGLATHVIEVPVNIIEC